MSCKETSREAARRSSRETLALNRLHYHAKALKESGMDVSALVFNAKPWRAA